MKRIMTFITAIAIVLTLSVVPVNADNSISESLTKHGDYEVEQLNKNKVKIIDKETGEREYAEVLIQDDGSHKCVVTREDGQIVVLGNGNWTTSSIQEAKNTDIVHDLDALISALLLPLDGVTAKAASLVKDVAVFIILNNMDVAYYTIEYQEKFDGTYLCKRRIYQYYKDSNYRNKLGSPIYSSVTYVGIGIYSDEDLK